ncbi:hypothetical protein [Mesorhizobium sp. WSM2239]|uniref:Uncharacterized protein n=2 Tax=unclassified Mesorhizobium TaxID=325217 RepID=A0AAU8DAP9_9HYPH
MPNTSIRAAAEGMPNKKINRRSMLAGFGVTAAVTAVTFRKAESSGLNEAGASSVGKESQMNMIANHSQFRETELGGQWKDPVFAAIREAKRLDRRWIALCREEDDAEMEARKEFGSRPAALIHWRNYYIGGSEIDQRRESLLDLGFDQEQVEREYLDAKARYRSQIAAGGDWDQRAGLVSLKAKVNNAHKASKAAHDRMSLTVPATVAGAVALINYAVKDIKDDTVAAWPWRAIGTATKALATMN